MEDQLPSRFAEPTSGTAGPDRCLNSGAYTGAGDHLGQRDCRTPIVVEVDQTHLGHVAIPCAPYVIDWDVP